MMGQSKKERNRLLTRTRSRAYQEEGKHLEFEFENQVKLAGFRVLPAIEIQSPTPIQDRKGKIHRICLPDRRVIDPKDETHILHAEVTRSSARGLHKKIQIQIQILQAAGVKFRIFTGSDVALLAETPRKKRTLYQSSIFNGNETI